MPSLKPRIKLTNKCENNCWYCYSDIKNNEEMTDIMISSVFQRIKKIYDNGHYNRIKFSLTGGDPFSSDIILKAIKIIYFYFKDIPFYICGDVCAKSNNEYVSQFVKKGGVCLLGVNENLLDEILEKVKIIGSQLYMFNVVLSDYNIDRIDKILDMVIKYKLPLRLDHLFGVNNSKNFIKKVQDCVNYVYPKLKDINIYNLYNCPFGNIHARSPSKRSYCGYGKDHYYINVRGYVRRCQMTDVIGHITDFDITEKIKIKTSKYIYDNCKQCDVFDFCKGGCPITNVNGCYCDVMYDMCSYFKNNIYTDKFYKDEFFKWKL